MPSFLCGSSHESVDKEAGFRFIPAQADKVFHKLPERTFMIAGTLLLAFTSFA
jgi:hypothetical protein